MKEKSEANNHILKKSSL